MGIYLRLKLCKVSKYLQFATYCKLDILFNNQ